MLPLITGADLRTYRQHDMQTIYAFSGEFVPPIQKSLQESFRLLSDGLKQGGVNIVASKPTSCNSRGKGSGPGKFLCTSMAVQFLANESNAFFGWRRDASNTGVAHGRSIFAATRGALNAIKHLCVTRWGRVSSSLLHLHHALEVSRVIYGLLYLELS